MTKFLLVKDVAQKPVSSVFTAKCKHKLSCELSNVLKIYVSTIFVCSGTDSTAIRQSMLELFDAALSERISLKYKNILRKKVENNVTV